MINFEIMRDLFRSFFYSSDGDYSISLLRFFVGLICVFCFLDLNSNKKYFSSKGYFPVDYRSNLGFVFTLFDLRTAKFETGTILFFVGLISSFFLLLGLFTPASCLLVFISLSSFAVRNPYVFHGGSCLLRLILFLMIFSKSGYELSLDKYLNIQNVFPAFDFFGKLIQIQISVMYIKTFWVKLLDQSWRDGSALYYARHNLIYSNLNSFKSLDFLFSSKPLLTFFGFFVMFIELSIGVFCLFSDFWFIAVSFGLVFHALFIYFLRIREFPYICIAVLSIFVPSELIESFINLWLQKF